MNCNDSKRLQIYIVICSKHEQQRFIGFKTRGDSLYFRPDKTRAASFLNGFKNEPSYEFISEAILKINLV